MSLPVAALLIPTMCQSAAVDVCLQQAGEEVVRRTLARRSSLRTGRVELQRTWTFADGHTIRRTETAWFAGERHRTDIWSHSDYEAVFRSHGVQAPRPLAILVWDGQHVLRRRADLSFTEWSVASNSDGAWAFRNRRYLGIPLSARSKAEPRCPFVNIEVLGLARTDELYTVTFRPNLQCGNGSTAQDTVAVFTIDPARDWALVAYRLEGEYEGGLRYTVVGDALYAQYGGVWFPQWLRQEQLRNGEFDWAAEYEVIDARFNEPVDPSAFTWTGMGIKPGTIIRSDVAGLPWQIWDGTRAVPWSAFRRLSKGSRPSQERP